MVKIEVRQKGLNLCQLMSQKDKNNGVELILTNVKENFPEIKEELNHRKGLSVARKIDLE